MAGRIQKQDVKTLTELTNAGGAASDLIQDTQIYVSALSLNKQLSQAIEDGDLSGGGGGGSLQWLEADISPLPAIENQMRVYLYSAASSPLQYLDAAIRIPTRYQMGKQIQLRMPFYSPDSSGNVLLQTISYLIRSGTDPVSSTTNSRTSTNSAVTLSSGTVNKPQAVVFDLTSATGQINAVSVSAGDVIRFRLYRNASDTATSDVRAMVLAAELTFN